MSKKIHASRGALNPETVRHLQCGDPGCTADHALEPIHFGCATCGPRAGLHLFYLPDVERLHLECHTCGKAVVGFEYTREWAGRIH